MSPRPVIFTVARAEVKRGTLYLATALDGGREQWIPLHGRAPFAAWVESTARDLEVSVDEAEAICRRTAGAEKVEALP